MKRLAAILSVVFMLSPALAVGDEESKILGIVDFGKTTLVDFISAVKAKGCNIDKSSGNNRAVRVANGCFNLPGNPSVSVNSVLARNGIIDYICLYYVQDQSDDFRSRLVGGTFGIYLKALQEHYSNPTKLINPFVGNKTALWVKKDIVIALEEVHTASLGTITYLSPEFYRVILNQDKKKKKKTGNDLDKL